MGHTNSGELMQNILETRARVLRKDVSVDVARADARYLLAYAKLHASAVEHAKLTKRLRHGSAILPAHLASTELGEYAATAAKRPAASKGKSARESKKPAPKKRKR